VPKAGGTVKHVVVAEAASLVYLAGQACITIHSWLSRADRLDQPDRMVFDLDPSRERPAEVRRAARLIASLLRELGIEPWVMTSGSRGYHLVVPLRRRDDFAAVRAFARDVATVAATREPRLFTTEQRKVKREGRILIDILRNGYAHTSVAPYSVRARPSAPVATPLHLDELSERGTRPDRWNVRTVLARLEREGDPWQEMTRAARGLGQARRALTSVLAET
jgi:bifunctional non-homologous end joining protein LigD